MDKPRQPRRSAAPDTERLDRIEAQTRENIDQIQRIARELANDRLGRIEGANERTARNLEVFETVVRGAMTIQQEQIAGLNKAVGAQQTQIEALREVSIAEQAKMRELRETVNDVIRQWQAYLSTIHPRQ
jgi:hypothetical protein